MAAPSTSRVVSPAVSPIPTIGSMVGKPSTSMPSTGMLPFPGMATGATALPYTPVLAAAIIGAFSFTSLALLLIFQVRKNKGSFFFLSMQGIVFLAAGLWARVALSVNSKNMVAFLIINLSNLIGPPFLFIGVSMTFTRIMWWITPTEKRNMKTLWFPPKFATMIFGGLALLIDNLKGFVSAPHSKLPLIFGLLEIFVCTIFNFSTVRYHIISKRWVFEKDVGNRWRLLTLVCIGATSLYILRLIYKTVLYSVQDQNPKSLIVTEESFFWYFDMIPLLLMYTLFAVVQPGIIIPRPWTRSSFDSEITLELLRLRKLVHQGEAEVELQRITVHPDKPWPLEREISLQ